MSLLCLSAKDRQCLRGPGQLLGSIRGLRHGYRVCSRRRSRSEVHFRFCSTCGTTVFHTEDGVDNSVSVAVGAFTDPDFPAPRASVYDSRRHPWVQLPAHVIAFERDPP
jgi:hypothetical protein